MLAPKDEPDLIFAKAVPTSDMPPIELHFDSSGRILETFVARASFVLSLGTVR